MQTATWKFDHVGIQVGSVDVAENWLVQMFGARKDWDVKGSFPPAIAEKEPNLNRVAQYVIGKNVVLHVFDQIPQGAANDNDTNNQLGLIDHLAFSVNSKEKLDTLRAKWLEIYPQFSEQYAELKTNETHLCQEIGIRADGTKYVWYCKDPYGVGYEIVAPYEAAPA